MELRTYQQRDNTLVPETERHGRGFAGRDYTAEEMNETAGYISEAVATGTPPAGYRKRFFADTPGFSKSGGKFYLPDGYDAISPDRDDAPERLRELMDTSCLTSPPDALNPWQTRHSLQEYYREMGWATDQNGRAVNPHLEQLISDERIGLNTNLGVGFTCGENVVVDVVVDDGTHVLLTMRTDSNKVIPSLVGGYTISEDHGVTDEQWFLAVERQITREGIFRGARRVTKLKTGIDLPDTDEAKYDIAWAIYPTSSYHTANFWTVVFTVHVRVENGMARYLTPTDNRQWGHWVRRTELDAIRPDLWPDHNRGLDACLTLSK